MNIRWCTLHTCPLSGSAHTLYHVMHILQGMCPCMRHNLLPLTVWSYCLVNTRPTCAYTSGSYTYCTRATPSPTTPLHLQLHWPLLQKWQGLSLRLQRHSILFALAFNCLRVILEQCPPKPTPLLHSPNVSRDNA